MSSKEGELSPGATTWVSGYSLCIEGAPWLIRFRKKLRNTWPIFSKVAIFEQMIKNALTMRES